MSENTAVLPDWDRVLSSAYRLQQVLPEAVLVGGTAAAIHAEHRLSQDADHVVPDLRRRFDEILAQLESAAGWRTARVTRPVQILGSLDAEQLRTQASQTLATQKDYLSALKAKICAQAPALCRFFPDRPTALAALGLPTWPEYLSEPKGAHGTSSPDALARRSNPAVRPVLQGSAALALAAFLVTKKQPHGCPPQYLLLLRRVQP